MILPAFSSLFARGTGSLRALELCWRVFQKLIFPRKALPLSGPARMVRSASGRVQAVGGLRFAPMQYSTKSDQEDVK